MNEINNRGDQKGTKISVIQTLRIHGPVSRIELTRLTGLSRATISLVISDLMASGLVRETEQRYSTGGRPATLLELTSDSKVMIGADFSSQSWILGAFDLLGNIVQKSVIPVGSNAPEIVIRALAEAVNEFVDRLEDKPLKMIGLGMPGLADVHRGIIRSAADLGWNGVEITREIQELIGWPSVVLNRHRARGLAECRFGAARDYKEVIYIGIGTGIAAGIFNNRQLLSGTLGGAGELGHVTVIPNGPLCPCGNRGCLQQLATGPAIEQNVRMLIRSGKHSVVYPQCRNDLQLVDAELICKCADQGDALCREVIGEAAGYVGIAMANLVNVLNPEAIILGGPIPISSEYFVNTATQVMRQRAMSPLADQVAVSTASCGEIGGALGAANYALDQKMGYSLFID
jgi:predicted NBD/HSP70 family sugar kinase